MHILISNNSELPIYQQIVDQITQHIVLGQLEGGAPLPSIRTLAKELGISVITTKRAYDELDRMNYIETVPGKGSYVSLLDEGLLKEKQLEKITNQLDNIIMDCQRYGISQEELIETIRILYSA